MLRKSVSSEMAPPQTWAASRAISSRRPGPQRDDIRRLRRGAIAHSRTRRVRPRPGGERLGDSRAAQGRPSSQNPRLDLGVLMHDVLFEG